MISEGDRVRVNQNGWRYGTVLEAGIKIETFDSHGNFESMVPAVKIRFDDAPYPGDVPTLFVEKVTEEPEVLCGCSLCSSIRSK